MEPFLPLALFPLYSDCELRPTLLFTSQKRGGLVSPQLRASDEHLLRVRVLRAGGRPTGSSPLLPPLPAHPTAHTAEIPAEPALPAAPILPASQSRIGMPEIRPAEPPEKPQGSAGRGDGDPET